MNFSDLFDLKNLNKSNPAAKEEPFLGILALTLNFLTSKDGKSSLCKVI